MEIGICLIAVNLPSIWLLLTSVTPEAVIRSVRSIASLSSRGSSQGSAGSGNPRDIYNQQLKSYASASVSSDAPMHTMTSQAAVSAYGNTYELDEFNDMPKSEIRVGRSVEQTTHSKTEHTSVA